MKPGHFFAALALLFSLAACERPVVIPANVAVTLPPNQNFIISATVPVTPLTPTMVGPSQTPTLTPTATPTVTPTPTASLTPTWTPVPTRRSPFPAAQGTPIIDLGFQEINFDNLAQLTPVFTALESTPRHFALSGDREKLFLATSTGLFLFNRQGEVLAHWEQAFTLPIDCETCLSINRDGSRLALMTRNAGSWEAQVYDVAGDTLTSVFALPVEPLYQGLRNEANIAISPDNNFLAFQAGPGTLRVIDLVSKLQVLGYDRRVDGISFTPDGEYFIIHGGPELLFYQVPNWTRPANNLLLPREDVPFTVSPSGKFLAWALPTQVRIYSIEALQIVREINVAPITAKNRVWEIDFSDDQTLRGYAVRPGTAPANPTVETYQWEVKTGKALSAETQVDVLPDPLTWLWGTALTLPSTKGELEAGDTGFQALRFISDTMFMANSPHSACWFKVFTAETTCFKNADQRLFATDGNTYTEILSEKASLLQDRAGVTIFNIGPYRFQVVSRTGEWAVIESGKGVNLYVKGKSFPQEAVKGSFQGFAENADWIALSTLEKENSFTLTMIDKKTGDALFQKPDNFLYPPLLMTADGTVYYLQRDLDQNQTILNYLDPETHKINEYTRFFLPAEPRVLTLSNNGLFAIGQADGAVLVMLKDGGQQASFQAATSAIQGLSFSPNGHFLLVASAEGLRVFAILP